jgi:hypothetical protein
MARSALPGEINGAGVKQFINDLISNEATLAPGLQGGGFEENLLAQAGMATDIAGRVGALSSRAGVVANLLNEAQASSQFAQRWVGGNVVPFRNGQRAGFEAGLNEGSGRSVRGTPGDVSRTFLALAKTGQAVRWLKYVERRMKEIDERQRAQAAMFDENPDVASAYHEGLRALEAQNKRAAAGLQDWSKS